MPLRSAQETSMLRRHFYAWKHHGNVALEYLIEITTGDGANIMNPLKTGEVAATIAEAVAPETAKIAESAAHRLLEAGGVLSTTAARAEVGTISLGGPLPADLPKYFATDFHITNVTKPMSDEFAHEILGPGAGHEFLIKVGGRTDAYREATRMLNPPMELDRTVLTYGWSGPNSSEWTPAVKEMMRKAFLKTEA